MLEKLLVLQGGKNSTMCGTECYTELHVYLLKYFYTSPLL